MRALCVGIGLLLAGTAPASEWRVDHDASRLGFSGIQYGDRFEGRFREFAADMRFDPNDLRASRFDVTVNTASADTGSRQRDSTLKDPAWFHVEAYPKARFVTSRIRRSDGDYAYKAVGELTIRDHTRKIALPFDWTIDDRRAHMQGVITLDRTNFGVGQDEWSDCDTVGCEVEVIVDLTLERSQPE